MPNMLSRRFSSPMARASGAQWVKQFSRTAVPLGSFAVRCFGATRPALVRTTEMTEADLGAVRVDQNRLMDTLHYTCGFGTGQRWGRQDH